MVNSADELTWREFLRGERYQVLRSLARSSNYVDDLVDAVLRQRMDDHFKECKSCQSVLDGTRNIVKLASKENAFDLPPGVARRLYSKLEQHLKMKAPGPGETSQAIPLGITEDLVPIGSHLIYFWESDEDFERGVRFLYPGLGKGEHCILFGHDEAIARIFETLRRRGYDSQRLINDLDLTVIRRQSSAQATLSDIRDVVQAAMRSGATAIRFLGNLGMGRDPLPAGEDDVSELECKATALHHSSALCDRVHVRCPYTVGTPDSQRRVAESSSRGLHRGCPAESLLCP